MEKKNLKDIGVRAFKTFIQGFLGSLAVTLPGVAGSDLTNGAVLVSLLIGAAAAGLSAVMNFIIALLNKEEE